MFRLFSNKKENPCPIDREMRLWMENSFLWLAGQFGQENIASKPILLPTSSYFPIKYDGSKESLIRTAEIVAHQMEIDINDVILDLYEHNIQEFSGDFGHRIWTELDKESDEKFSAGQYYGKNDQGKFEVFIEKNNLINPETLVATIAHEFAHIKILGEERLDFNDEFLTDLTPVVFGLGVFNANAAFKEVKSFDGYGHNSVGYLKQKEWGYALALYAFYRGEENPEWVNSLTSNVKSDFKKSMAFIYDNTDKVFIEEYKSEN